MEKRERDEDRAKVPGEAYEEFEPAQIPAGPDGGPEIGFGGLAPAPAPPAMTPENCICLRGPCRHYWHMTTFAGEGNPEGTFEAMGRPALRSHHHTCVANPGMETDITEDCVFDCSRWDPLLESELVQIDTRRELFYSRNPHFRPAEDAVEELGIDDEPAGSDAETDADEGKE